MRLRLFLPFIAAGGRRARRAGELVMERRAIPLLLLRPVAGRLMVEQVKAAQTVILARAQFGPLLALLAQDVLIFVVTPFAQLLAGLVTAFFQFRVLAFENALLDLTKQMRIEALASQVKPRLPLIPEFCAHLAEDGIAHLTVRLFAMGKERCALLLLIAAQGLPLLGLPCHGVMTVEVVRRTQHEGVLRLLVRALGFLLLFPGLAGRRAFALILRQETLLAEDLALLEFVAEREALRAA